jgi:hypothetical protein
MIAPAAQDPVQPPLGAVGRASSGLARELPAQAIAGQRRPTDEFMQPIVAQQPGHLLGVLDPKRLEDETLGGDGPGRFDG